MLFLQYWLSFCLRVDGVYFDPFFRKRILCSPLKKASWDLDQIMETKVSTQKCLLESEIYVQTKCVLDDSLIDQAKLINQ